MIEKLKVKIAESDYWDARVIKLECNYFGDEVRLMFEGAEENQEYLFEGCYKIQIEHCYKYLKKNAAKKLKHAQIPYFMQDIEVEKRTIEGKEYLVFQINMYPIELVIVCSNFSIL